VNANEVEKLRGKKIENLDESIKIYL